MSDESYEGIICTQESVDVSAQEGVDESIQEGVAFPQFLLLFAFPLCFPLFQLRVDLETPARAEMS